MKAHEFGKFSNRPNKNVFTLNDINSSTPSSTSYFNSSHRSHFSRNVETKRYRHQIQYNHGITLLIFLVFSSIFSIIVLTNSQVAISGGIIAILVVQAVVAAISISQLALYLKQQLLKCYEKQTQKIYNQ
ncbi:hypothetical protein CP10139811_0094 [Chlamydia ibidis]|uniref:Uncharacterized protein n=2 Tax=Chlamydia ibidis TaxID=1405396 RepID=S7J604_9CHLA|nr:hypothetical protein [Chlamydia ibidis]EPP35597.1 hypothetical protein CP10139811_0094 [Chlamydia ibidis]EQM62598.1 hypothetical protein H359_0537 [Chlamydia ibidis 10-1398/6]